MSSLSQRARLLVSRGTLLLSIVALGVMALAVVETARADEQAPRVYSFSFSDGGSSAYLGVTIEERAGGAPAGVRITEVVDGSPAEQAGLAAGDVIVEFDGEAVDGPAALTRKIHSRKPGDRVRVDVLRGERRESFLVDLGDRKEVDRSWFVWDDDEGSMTREEWADRMREMGERYGEWAERFTERFQDPEWQDRMRGNVFRFRGMSGKPRLGVQLTETTPELREHLGGSAEAGVLVSKVMPDTPAARAGIKVGDLILSAGGKTVGTSSELVLALADQEGVIDLELVRDGRRITLEADIGVPADDSFSGPRAMLAPLPPLPDVVLPALAPLAELPELPDVVLPALAPLAPLPDVALPAPPPLPVLAPVPAPPAPTRVI